MGVIPWDPPERGVGGRGYCIHLDDLETGPFSQLHGTRWHNEREDVRLSGSIEVGEILGIKPWVVIDKGAP